MDTFDATLFFAISTENAVWRNNRVIRNDYCPSWGKPPFLFRDCEGMRVSEH